MINCELQAALAEAKAKGSLLEISEEFLLNLVHSALSFDDNNLKIEEVESVLKGQYVGVNSEKVRRITNQKNAFERIVAMAKEGIELTEDELKDLHQILMEGFNIPGGLYRNVDISVKGSNHTPCSYIKVYDRMEKYINYIKEGPKEDVLEYISYCHLQLAKIHPFLDGNGRLARLVLNYELMSNGFAPVIITSDERDKYHNALEQFKVEKEIEPFKQYLSELELKSIKKYY